MNGQAAGGTLLDLGSHWDYYPESDPEFMLPNFPAGLVEDFPGGVKSDSSYLVGHWRSMGKVLAIESPAFSEVDGKKMKTPGGIPTGRLSSTDWPVMQAVARGTREP